MVAQQPAQERFLSMHPIARLWEHQAGAAFHDPGRYFFASVGG
jgi:hypothetical protein